MTEGEKMAKILKACIFDLDGVITDTAEYHFIAWQKIAAELGIIITREFNETLKGIDRETSLQRILTFANMTINPEKTIEVLTKKNEYYNQLLEKLTQEDILPGIEELLKVLKSHKIKTAVASVSRNAPKILEKLGVIDQFDVIIDPNSVNRGKPYPDIFVEAANVLHEPIENCIAIEDAVAGIQAIVAAGIVAIGIGEEVLYKSGATIVYPSTASLTYDGMLDVFENTNR